MSPETQLWQTTSTKFRLPGSSLERNDDRWAAPRLRILFWPSGKVCWEVNAYLIWMRKQGLRTSSINTYASELSSFVRFLEEVNTQFLETCDETLIDFADWLQHRKRCSSRHTNRLVLRAIAMLDWLQRLMVGHHLVDSVGRGAQISITISHIKKDGFFRRSIRHPALVASEPRLRVRPISLDALNALLGACNTSAKSSFCVSRNHAIVVLLADSGIRREEVVWIKCVDISRALTDGGGLQIRTSKRPGNPKRVVPVPYETLRHISDHVEVHRALHLARLKRKNPGFKDEDWAFCTRTGGQLAPETVTQLFRALRKLAGVSERATAHMLRHRYITLQVVHRLKQLQTNQSIGVEATTTILSRVSSLSGHAKLSSLWTYVDWAYDELAAAPISPKHIQAALAQVTEIIAKLDSIRAQELLEPLQNIKTVLQRTETSAIATQSVATHSLRGLK